MAASTHVEFVFWRSRHSAAVRRGLEFMEDEDPYPVEKPNTVHHSVTRTWTEKIRRNLWDRKRKIVSSLIIGLAASYVLHLRVSLVLHLERYSWLPFSVILVILHLVLSKEISCISILGLYLLGFVVGFLGGPVYLGLHAFRTVRTSDTWARISVGANMGFAYLALTLLLIFEPSEYMYAGFGGIFTWVYGILSSYHVHYEARETRESTGSST